MKRFGGGMKIAPVRTILVSFVKETDDGMTLFRAGDSNYFKRQGKFVKK